MKLLSIGNSFSQDAQAWLHRIAVLNGVELDTVNLFIGGCDLATHCRHITDGEAAYALEKNGEDTHRMIALSDALIEDRYDVITLQQASHYSGRPQTYVPYLTQLAAYCREKQQQATLYFHETWAYDENSDHWAFPYYHNNQQEMFARLQDAGRMATALIDAALLPVGRVIQFLREEAPAFAYPGTGRSLCRDGFHLSLDYGRYAAAATWFRVLTGRLPVNTPPELEGALLKTIHEAVEKAVALCRNGDTL